MTLLLKSSNFQVSSLMTSPLLLPVAERAYEFHHSFSYHHLNRFSLTSHDHGHRQASQRRQCDLRS